MKLNIEGVQGCTDGGCIFGHPGGMHTNGGCHCLRDVRPTTQRLRLMRNVHLLVKEVRQLRGNLSLAEEGLANATQETAELRSALTACQAERDGMRATLEHIAHSGCPYETCVALAQSGLRKPEPQPEKP